MDNCENKTLATELLHELKASVKRWFIIAIVELVIILGIVTGFLWYISLPVEEGTVITQDTENNSGDNQVIGGNYYGETSN